MRPPRRSRLRSFDKTGRGWVCVDSAAVGDYDDARMNETWKNLRNSFFAGLLVVVPVAASVLILLGIFTWVTDFMLPDALRQQMLTPLYRIVALILFVAFTIGVGWVTRLVIGKRMVSAKKFPNPAGAFEKKGLCLKKKNQPAAFWEKKEVFPGWGVGEFPTASQ